MKSGYPVQIIKTSQKEAKVSFCDDCSGIEDNLKITPMVFCFLDSKVVLSFDKTGEWNSQCGHRNNEESIKECLHREAFEEAGVTIDSLSEFGTLKYETFKNNLRKYPPITYIPIYSARVTKITDLPINSEVKSVLIVDDKEARLLLGDRDDNKLLLSIYEKCREKFFSNDFTS